MELDSFLSAIPATWWPYAALLIIACNLVTVLIRPPGAGSRWVLPYRIISALALNIGWAANHIKPGQNKAG